MERFKDVLKAKGKALSIFEEAKTKLQNVVAKYRSHHEESEKAVLEHTAAIEDEHAAQAFAKNEMQNAQNTIEKINQIIS